MLTGSRQARWCVRSGYLGWEDDQERPHDAVLADGEEHSTTTAGSCLASGGGPQMLTPHQGDQGHGGAQHYRLYRDPMFPGRNVPS